MSWSFQPGMRVRCVNDDWGLRAVRCPRRGEICTVTDVDFYPKGTSLPDDNRQWRSLTEDVMFLELAEFGASSFDADHFRPLTESGVESLRVHLAPKPRERVSA